MPAGACSFFLCPLPVTSLALLSDGDDSRTQNEAEVRNQTMSKRKQSSVEDQARPSVPFVRAWLGSDEDLRSIWTLVYDLCDWLREEFAIVCEPEDCEPYGDLGTLFRILGSDIEIEWGFAIVELGDAYLSIELHDAEAVIHAGHEDGRLHLFMRCALPEHLTPEEAELAGEVIQQCVRLSLYEHLEELGFCFDSPSSED